jgi:hypothetical protein
LKDAAGIAWARAYLEWENKVEYAVLNSCCDYAHQLMYLGVGHPSASKHKIRGGGPSLPTERPITIIEVANILVGTDPERIVAEAQRVLRGEGKAGRVPELWDGRAAKRIVQILHEQTS